MYPKFFTVWPANQSPCSMYMLLIAKALFSTKRQEHFSRYLSLSPLRKTKDTISNTELKFTIHFSTKGDTSVGFEHCLSEFCFIPYCPFAVKSISLDSWTSLTQLRFWLHFAPWHRRLFSFSLFTSLILVMVWTQKTCLSPSE